MRLCRGSLCTFNRAVHPPSTKVNISLFLVTFLSHEPKVLLSQNVRLVEKPVGWNRGSRGKTDITRPTQRHKPLDRLCPKPTNPVQIGGCETVVKLDTLNIFILGTRRVFPLPARNFHFITRGLPLVVWSSLLCYQREKGFILGFWFILRRLSLNFVPKL